MSNNMYNDPPLIKGFGFATIILYEKTKISE